MEDFKEVQKEKNIFEEKKEKKKKVVMQKRTWCLVYYEI